MAVFSPELQLPRMPKNQLNHMYPFLPINILVPTCLLYTAVAIATSRLDLFVAGPSLLNVTHRYRPKKLL